MIVRFCLLAGAALVLSLPSLAQNLGGVPSPKLGEDLSVAQVRGAYVPAENGRDDRYALRAHYHRSISPKLVGRIIAIGSDSGSGFDYDAVKGEVHWQVTPKTDRFWHLGLRGELTIRDGAAPDALSVHWMNEFDLSDRFAFRANAVASRDIGANARDGVFLQSRFAGVYKLDDGYSLSGLVFNNYGSSEDFGDFDTQNHQAGPVFGGPAGDNWSWSTGVLFGVSEAAPDSDFRLWITRSF